MSALGAVEETVLTGTVVPPSGGVSRPQPRMRLLVPAEAGSPGRDAGQAGETDEGAGRGRPSGGQASRRQPGPTARRTPVRLTRRGRIVVATVAVLGAIVAVLLVSLLAAGGARASNHSQPGGPYRGMHEIVVQPGQTLWSIASAAEPTADPRIVISQIMAVNALSGTDIQAGQLLWVPR